ncbi:MAG: hypothetical protein HYZ42_12640, partial [Bacteroidetes bacterium]|nr:hypothetical protein [Bacteroidota bacterium]
MKKKIWIYILGAMLLGLTQVRNENRYRWDIKTLTDKVGQSLIQQKSSNYEISDIVKLPRPAKKLLGKNRSKYEQI